MVLTTIPQARHGRSKQMAGSRKQGCCNDDDENFGLSRYPYRQLTRFLRSQAHRQLLAVVHAQACPLVRQCPRFPYSICSAPQLKSTTYLPNIPAKRLSQGQPLLLRPRTKTFPSLPLLHVTVPDHRPATWYLTCFPNLPSCSCIWIGPLSGWYA